VFPLLAYLLVKVPLEATRSGGTFGVKLE
jgi:hypothetical protein